MAFQNIIENKPDNFPVITDQYFDSVAFAPAELPQIPETSDSISGTFLQPVSIKIDPLLKTSFQYEWMTDVLLLLLFGMAVLWFVAPNRLAIIHRVKHSFAGSNEATFQRSGFLSSFLFYLNYLLALVMFIILVIGQFVGESTTAVLPAHLIVFTASAFVAYSLYRLAFIAFAGFLFKTNTTALQQIRLYVSLDNLTGFLMLPILLLILFTEGHYFFYFGLLILLIANTIKWFQTIVIGKSVSQFRLYHLIVYLCTLEIIPLLLLIKLIRNLSV